MQSEKAQLEAAEHNVDTFDAQLQFKTIIAPYDGVVTARNINVGDYINKDGNISDKDAVTNFSPSPTSTNFASSSLCRSLLRIF